MKSLFKRTLAAASSTVLVLTQVAGLTNINISAAETAEPAVTAAETTANSDKVINKEWILDVPFDKTENPLLTADGAKTVMVSDWGNLAEAKLMAVGDRTITRSINRAKSKIKKAMLKTNRISSAVADELLAQVDKGTVTVKTDGTAKGVAEIGDIGKAVGDIIEDEMSRTHDGKDITADDGAPISIDWSGFSIKGQIIAEAKADFGAKTISYKTYIVDEKGTVLDSDEKIEAYALAKVDEAEAIIRKAANECGHPVANFLKELDKYVARSKDCDGYIRKFTTEIGKIKEEATTLQDLYTSYSADVENAIAASGLEQHRVTRINNKIEEKKPASVDDALDNEKANKAYEKATEKINEKLGEYFEIDIPVSVVKETIKEAETIHNADNMNDAAYQAKYKIEGYSANAVVYLYDDQKADVLAKAIAAEKDGEKYYNAGYTVVLGNKDGEEITDFSEKKYEVIDIVSLKKVTGDYKSQFGVAGQAFFDVERVIPKVIVKEIEKEETTTSESESKPVTTTSTTDANTVTTTSEEKKGDETTTTTVISTTTTEPTQTTLATSVSFEFDGIEDQGLVYWSEETGKFDLSKLSVTLHFYEKGEEVGKSVDVTKAFELEAASPKDLNLPEGVGLAARPVYFILKDESLVQKEILKAGYTQALIEQEGIKEGLKAGKLIVYLVLRGDSDLNGQVSAEDAQYCLEYYTETLVTLNTAKEVLANKDRVYLANKGDKAETYFAFSHYAMDVMDGDGIISVDDAQMILNYYAVIVVTQKEGTWNHAEVVGHDVTPKDELHVNPFIYDDAASKDYKGFDKSAAELVE